MASRSPRAPPIIEPWFHPRVVGFTSGLGTFERAGLFDALEQAATQVGLAVFIVHVDRSPPTVVYASKLLAEFVRRRVEDLVGAPPWDLVAPDQRELVRAIIASRGPGAPPMTLEFQIERPDGSRREIEVGVARITSPEAELAVCYFRDVTDERTAFAALLRSEGRFRCLIENAPDGVVILRDGRITLANPVAVRMLGGPDLESVRGRSLLEFLPPEDGARALERIEQARAGVELRPSEYRVLPTARVVEVHSIPLELEGEQVMLAFVRDVTERARLNEALLRSDRLAATGTMAAAVAHEINNPMTYVQLNLHQLENEVESEPDPARAARLRECISNAKHGVERVVTIVRDLRTYARDDTAPVGPVDVIAVVERALQMVEHDLRHRAQLVRRFRAETVVVEAVAGRLEQVVVNLLLNAIQSLGTGDPSTDRITVDVEVDSAVTLTVTDTGAGIAAEDRTRVFEPFFTTKPVGEGTGLGLSICKSIVESMKGRIEIASESGVGTAISVRLPIGTVPRPEPAPSGAATVVARRLRVLVIDDEPKLRESLRMLLRDFHDVDDTDGGDHVLAMLRERDYDAVLCDLMMPRMNGRELYERIRECHPGLERRIVFVTGGAFIASLATFLESVDNPKLLKPYSLVEVLAALQAVVRATDGRG